MSVWSDRDLPVLRYLHEHPLRHEMLSTNWQSKAPHPDLPGLTEQDVHVAVETLVDERLVSYRNDSWNTAGGVHWIGTQVTGAGLQALEQWPVFDMFTSPEELGLLLDGLAEMAATEEEESNLREAARRDDRLDRPPTGHLGAHVRRRRRLSRGAERGRMTDPTPPEPAPLRLERMFKASARAVFDAWTSAEMLRLWWPAGSDWETPVAEVDVRVGGSLRLVMRSPDGEEFAGRGEYLEVARPERLVFTWTWDGHGGHEGAQLVQVEFTEREDGTTNVVLTNRGLRDEESKCEHRQGWEASFDNLDRVLAE